jgi:hypothetical protein
MTTTAFQWVFDHAESVLINRRAIVAQTVSRDQTIRSVSRGGQIWRFNVQVPNGIPWTECRSAIEAIDVADRFTPATVQINNPGYSDWFMNYRGDGSGFAGTWTRGQTYITLTAGSASTYKFRAGDLIQLGSTGHVYTAAADVPASATTVPLNRPILDATGSGALTVGPNCTFNLRCTVIPDWSIFQRNQVSWTGAFSFVEVIA